MTETDIKSPVVLLTGPTSGIGAAMLDRLTRHPSRPRLVLLARDAAGLQRAVGQVRARGLDVRGLRVELTDLASVHECAVQLAADQKDDGAPPIDVAILNAGAQFTNRRKKGAEGYELTFTVNVIAQHLLMRRLEPLMAPAAHVVLMGSSTHRGKRASFNLVPDPKWRDPAVLATADSEVDPPARANADLRAGGEAYATSKLALVTLSHDWAQRLSTAGSRLNIYDPGLVAGTGLGKDMPAYRYWVWKRLMPAMSVLPGATTPNDTARHAVALAMGDVYPDLNDGYVEIGRLARAEAVTFDVARRAALWGWLESVAAGVDARPAQARTA